MSLSIYFEQDLQRGLTATMTAVLATSLAHGAGNVEFVRGALTVGKAQADMYGLDWSYILDDLRATGRLGDDLAGLLDTAQTLAVASCHQTSEL